MCGISGIINHYNAKQITQSMVKAQTHRGPDANGLFSNDSDTVAFGHNRLSIIDLTDQGNQPLYSNDNRYVIIFNGEVYNYKEIKTALSKDYDFKTQTDTEVVLAAWLKWGDACLERFIGMFAFVIWDKNENKMFAARDRFGVKPFHFVFKDNYFLFSSEIKSIFASGLINKHPNKLIWSTYLINGLYDHSNNTFWEDIIRLEAGHYIRWEPDTIPQINKWYDLVTSIVDKDRNEEDVMEELLFLLEDSIKLRFRSDVPVGICLSGGLDSSLLLALTQRVKGKDYPIHAFTFYTGSTKYDELPWVEKMIADSAVIHHACKLNVEEIPSLAQFISDKMDEPYGGIPTLGMSKVFEKASTLGIKVLLDGNGVDEGWGGYDYYRKASSVNLNTGPVQGSTLVKNLKSIIIPELLSLLVKDNNSLTYHKNTLVNLQCRDVLLSKIPRSMRFADRNSMAYSLELREPFLDHRIIELGLSQPDNYKIRNNSGKYLVRKLANKIIPKSISEAPKHAVQTPQREWLADDLSCWIESLIIQKKDELSEWFSVDKLIAEYFEYKKDKPDNSFYIWQIINTALLFNKPYQ